jgi:glutathione S-transferase
MPIDPNAVTEVVGFCNVPDFAKGKVRDLRVRWALEEIGRPYRTTLYDAFAKRPAELLARQPFGQVPALSDGTVDLFESGAILLYLGEQDERLLPREGQAKWDAVAWLIAALNSIEPAIMNYVWVTLFNAQAEWSKAAEPAARQFMEQRLKRLADALAGKDWLAGRFSVADIMMVTVLRNLPDEQPIEPALAEYRRRGEARPAFQQALADQLSQFVGLEEGAEA